MGIAQDLMNVCAQMDGQAKIATIVLYSPIVQGHAMSHLDAFAQILLKWEFVRLRIAHLN